MLSWRYCSSLDATTPLLDRDPHPIPQLIVCAQELIPLSLPSLRLICRVPCTESGRYESLPLHRPDLILNLEVRLEQLRRSSTRGDTKVREGRVLVVLLFIHLNAVPSLETAISCARELVCCLDSGSWWDECQSRMFKCEVVDQAFRIMYVDFSTNVLEQPARLIMLFCQCCRLPSLTRDLHTLKVSAVSLGPYGPNTITNCSSEILPYLKNVRRHVRSRDSAGGFLALVSFLSTSEYPQPDFKTATSTRAA